MKKVYSFWLLCGLLVSFSQLPAQSVTFQRTYSGTGSAVGNHVILTGDGYVIAGQTNSSPGGPSDAYLMRVNLNGNVLWQNSYGGELDDAFTLVTAADDGGFLAMGQTQSQSAGGTDVFVVKVTADGFVEWSKTFGTNVDDVSPIQAKIVNFSDGYLISGYQNDFGTIRTFLVRLSNSGNVIWQRLYTGGSNFMVGNYVSGDTIYVAGSIENDGCFAKIDANNGDFLSLRVFPESFNDALYNIRPTQDGNLLLSDNTWTPGAGVEQRQWVVKTTPDGEVLWSKTYSKSGINLRGVANNVSDGGFILAPYTTGFNAASDANLAKIDSNGTLLWAYSYGGPSDDNFTNAIQTSDGGFIAIGSSYNPENGNDNILLVKTDANGLVDGCSPKTLNLLVQDLPAEPFGGNLLPEDFATGENWDVSMSLGTLALSDYCRALEVVLDTTFTLCPGQSVTIAGNAYTAPAVVLDTIPGDPDTIVTYTLLLAPQPGFSDTLFICPGQSVTVNGVVYTQPTIITDTLLATAGGCDTLATYVILENESPVIEETIQFYAGDSVTINGIVYTQPDTVLALLPATVGCDTLAIYYLQFLSDTLSGIVNSYTPVNAFNCDSTLLQVGSAEEFSAGDKVLIIQMQGATVDLSDSTSFGTVTDLGSAGNYEFNRIQSISGNAIQLKFSLTKSYDITGKVQLIRVPEYTDIIASNLTCKPWDGTTGGVLAIDVADTLTMIGNADVRSKGFRGGALSNGTTSFYHETQFFYSPNPNLAAAKGEGVAILPLEKSYGRGQAANGGGGGNAHNAGGGGGANAGNGGDGGLEYYSIPSLPTPGTQGIGGDKLLENSLDRLIMGGGGGAGHANDFVGTAGGNGGGIIIIKAKTIEASNQVVQAAGEDVFGPNGNNANDGQGGGGAGGTILLDVQSLNGSLVCNAAGGRGGDCLFYVQSQIIGPGGGGGGGKMVITNPIPLPSLVLNTQGGAHGIANQNISNEAQNGEEGKILVGSTVVVDTLVPTITFAVTQPRCTTLGQITVLNGSNSQFSLNNGPLQSNPVFENLVPGQYLITVQDTTQGCTKDSLVTLILQDTLAETVIEVLLCSGESVTINNVVYDQPATVIDTLASTTGGCDTVATYNITFAPQPTITQTISFCAGDSVTIDGISYTQMGTVSSVIPASVGCDTLATYILQVVPQLEVTRTISFCSGDSVVIDGVRYTQPGTVSSLIPVATGCDTLITYTLEFAPQPTITRTISFCSGDSVTIDGTIYREPQTVLGTLPAVTGCDTSATYILEFATQPIITRTISFCPGASVTIDGVVYDEPQTVSGIIPAATGCDTLATYILELAPQLSVTRTVSFCPGQVLTIDGVTYTQPGTVSSIIPATTGCDTLVTYILELTPQPTVTRTVSFCPGESVTINGVAYTEPGTVSGIILASTGCDTLATYVLEFATQPSVTRTLSFCPGESVTIDGVVYTEPQTVSSTIPATTGCDTLATYVLEFATQLSVTRTLSFCPGESVTIDGVVYTEPQTVSSTIPATTGCDTLATYVLEFAIQPSVTRTLSFCPGESVTIDGVVYTEPQTVSGTIPAVIGCDTLATYVLEFATQPSVTRTLSFCPGESVTIDGVNYTEPQTVSSTIPANTGCDTLATYVLEFAPQPTITVPIFFCPGDLVSIDGVTYTQPGTVVSTIPATTGCDTVATYVLQFAPQPTLSQTIEFCNGDSVFLRGVTYTQPGTVELILPSLTGGCDTVATYTLQYLVPNYPTSVTLSCPSNISVVAEAGAVSVPISYTLPTATSDCPCPGIALNLQQGLTSGSNFPTGLTNVCYAALDSCGNSTTCCFNVNVEATNPCDVKLTSCIRFELLDITADAQQRKTYRIRAINNCTSRLTNLSIQLPDGVVADSPANNSTYSAPSGRTYTVRNPNYAPFYSLRYTALSDSIQNGESDIFKYTLPTQSVPAYIHVSARLESQVFYEAYLNTFFCSGGNEPRSADQSTLGEDFSLFPNPTDGMLFADLSAWTGQKVQIRIYSAQGRLLQSTQMIAEQQAQVVDMPSTLADGLYLLEVTPAQGKQQTKKFTLAH